MHTNVSNFFFKLAKQVLTLMIIHPPHLVNFWCRHDDKGENYRDDEDSQDDVLMKRADNGALTKTMPPSCPTLGPGGRGTTQEMWRIILRSTMTMTMEMTMEMTMS